jgi:glutamine synthetase
MQKELSSLREELTSRGIDVLRFLYSDVIGVARSKDVLVSQLEKVAHNGPAFSFGVLLTNAVGDVLEANNIANDGYPDMVTQFVSDSIIDIPWEKGLAYVVVDLVNPDGSPTMRAPRTVLKKVIEGYNKIGLQPVCGPELEFYIADHTPEGGYRRSLERTGRVYTTGSLVDPDGIFLDLLRMVDQMNIGAVAGNHEFSPAQYEINLWHSEALDATDRTFFFKTAVKDIVNRAGKHATFVGKPWSDEGGSGFHLHFSVTDMNGTNQMHDGAGNLSVTAKQMIAGVTAHAPALTALTNPSINAFKRLGPDTLAPYRANWGFDNRSCMIRVPPEREQGTRLEVRVGDGMANPYLLTAAILAAALDGIVRDLPCPVAAEGMSYDNEADPILPMTLAEALDALDADAQLRTQLSDELINIFMVMKRDEVARYTAAVKDPATRDVTDWEVNEYVADF